MKNIEISDDVYQALQRLATGFHRTPDEVLASLLHVPSGSPEPVESIAAFVIGSEFRAKCTDAERYVALLSWIAARHAAELGEFIFGQSSGGRYVGLTREEIIATCRHNQACQIDGTQYWAIMNIDLATKRRFLGRLLEFIGYRDAVIELVCSAFGGRIGTRRGRAWELVA